MLIKRWRCLFLVTATAFLITYASPVLAAFKLPVSNLENDNYFQNTITIVDNSILSSQSKQASTVLQQLNLTREQQEKIKKIHHKYKQQIYKKKE